MDGLLQGGFNHRLLINSHLELEGIDPDIIATCVEQLRDEGLIVLKHGRTAGSVDYHDYMVSANRTEFYNWKYAKMKSKIEMTRQSYQRHLRVSLRQEQ